MLTFGQLREANLKRCSQFKNAKGELCHKEGVKGWSASQWMVALAGELGEAADLIKKVTRGDLTAEEATPELAKELADIQTYLDLLAARCGIDLGQATINKFNEVSDRVGSSIKL